MTSISWLSDIDKNDTASVGGKGANLGKLARAGFAVPPGFVARAEACLEAIEAAGIRAELAG
jgi:phosphoenolpyruvate synthase/pyruvate phosphate dikinase